MISKDQLHSIMPSASAENLEKFAGPLSDTMERYQINTPQRMACFLAQLAHESGCLRYVKELADGKAYEGRKDLGNIIAGDGPKYKGRGLIQITGRSNYSAMAKVFGQDFLGHPELLEGPVWASMSAGWFWDAHQLNALADVLDFLKISKRINGVNKITGLPNGMEDRLKYFALAKQTFGIA